MQKIQQVLDRLEKALAQLDDTHKAAKAKQAEVEALELQCAHLRTDVSVLKKQKQELETRNKKATQYVEKAMAQIDQAMGSD